MPHLTESIAVLTDQRDRDDLEAQIVQVLADLIRPETVSFFKLLHFNDSLRVLPKVHYSEQTLTVKAPPDDPALLPCVEACLPAELLMKRSEAVAIPVHNGIKTLISVRNGRNAVGWIEIVSRHKLTEEHQLLLNGLLRIYANHLSILDYSEQDSLTGLMNRKTYDDSFMKLLARRQRDRSSEISANSERRRSDTAAQPLWLGVVDIDFFKRINDKFGHLYGDEVLVLLARLMTNAFRSNDRLYRFGGEEFVVVLDRVSPGKVDAVFERLRARVEDNVFPQVGKITVSLGYTMILPGDAPASAFERADAALYFAKQNGRNQVQRYESLIERGLLAAKENHADVELF